MKEPPPVHKQITLVKREEWGALPPKDTKKLKNPVPNVIFTYCTDTKDRLFPYCANEKECKARMREMQKYWMEDRGKKDIAYNFYVGGDGKVYEGRGWTVKPLKNREFASILGRSMEIAYIGDYHEKRPPKLMWHAAWDFCGNAVDNKLLESDYEFIENYDEKKLEEIHKKKPWYDQNTP